MRNGFSFIFFGCSLALLASLTHAETASRYSLSSPDKQIQLLVDLRPDGLFLAFAVGGAAVAQQQGLVQIHLQRPHLAAERRLRDVEHDGGAGEAAQLGNADEILDLFQVHGGAANGREDRTAYAMAGSTGMPFRHNRGAVRQKNGPTGDNTGADQTSNATRKGNKNLFKVSHAHARQGGNG